VTTEIIPVRARQVSAPGRGTFPAPIAEAGSNARFAYEEFFAGIDSPHTERAYRQAVHRFLSWCEARSLALKQVMPAHVGEYIKTLGTDDHRESLSKPTKKLHLAAIRHFFDKLVVRHAVALNPALSVRGPKHSVVEGRTPALSPNEVRRVLTSIDVTNVVGLRDRAVIGVLIYTACRVGAVAKLRRRDFCHDGRQRCLRLDEKGGKAREIPVRHDLEGFVDEFLSVIAEHPADDAAPLFRSAVRRTNKLTAQAMTANDIQRMVKRRLANAGFARSRLTCHSFRATTITDLLDQGVSLEDVQYLAGHADPRTTRLYDRRKKQVTRNIVERISI
jgi:site-specific recombinase XerD